MGFLHKLFTGAVLAGALALGTTEASAQGYRWGGLYIGASAGWIGSDINVDWGPGAGPRAFTHDDSGAFFGGHIGIQHQWNQLVIGAEMTVGGRAFDNSGAYATGSPQSGCPNPNFTCQARVDGMMVMIGGRLGWAFNNFLLYGQGGYATADVDTNAFFTATGAVEHTTSRRHDGYYVGGGLEYALTPNWIVGIDYRHVELDAKLHTSVPAGFAVKGIDATSDIVTARVTFKLGRPEERYEPMK